MYVMCQFTANKYDYLDGNVRWPRRVLPLVNHVEYAPLIVLTFKIKCAALY